MLKLSAGFLPWIILAAFGERWFVPALLLALLAAAVATARARRRAGAGSGNSASPRAGGGD